MRKGNNEDIIMRPGLGKAEGEQRGPSRGHIDVTCCRTCTISLDKMHQWVDSGKEYTDSRLFLKP